MIKISHRGNIDGRNESLENNPSYIDDAIKLGYNVEIDIWFIRGSWFLGHDEPKYEIEHGWIIDRLKKLWIHCKNIEAVEALRGSIYDSNFFWHENDTMTITSKGYLWVYPGKQPVYFSIAVLPEIYHDDVSNCIGVCSDFIKRYDV